MTAVPISETTAFEFMVNLDGLTVYVCQTCGDILEQDAIDIHAEGIHNSFFISILDVPIGSEENHAAQSEVEEAVNEDNDYHRIFDLEEDNGDS